MPRHLSAITLVFSLLLVACQPQTPVGLDRGATPEPTTQPGASAPSATSGAAVDAMAGAVAEGTQVLRINTQRGSVDCTGRHVEVLATNADLVFTGQCLELYFLGADTRASIQGAELVQVVADNIALDVETPLIELRQLGDAGRHRLDVVLGEVYVQGDGNQIRARSVSEVNLTGSRNRLHWQAGQPEISDLGNGNVVGID